MEAATRLDLSVQTGLVLTPQLQQSLKILQMSFDDLLSYVQMEADQNPFFEFQYTDPILSQGSQEGGQDNPEDSPFYERFVSRRENAEADYDWEEPPPSLHRFLEEQLLSMTMDPALRMVGRLLIERIDSAGYLDERLEDISQAFQLELTLLKDALYLIQKCEPTGVGARSLQECLMLQLKENGHWHKPFEILVEHLPWVVKKEWNRLAKLCQVSPDYVQEMVLILKKLTPKPGASYTSEYTLTRRPDIVVRYDANTQRWAASLNRDAVLSVVPQKAYYKDVMAQRALKEEKEKVKLFYQQANWLHRTIDQRYATILKVSQAIVDRQQSFFHQGPCGLVPLTLKQVASIVDLHESTVSRVTMHKSLETPLGIFDFKYFFHASLTGVFGEQYSTERVRSLIKELIGQENPQSPLSDEELSKILLAKGIQVARRTIAKYRESMGIASSHLRRT